MQVKKPYGFIDIDLILSFLLFLEPLPHTGTAVYPVRIKVRCAIEKEKLCTNECIYTIITD